ncbi:MAG: hypothetical protein R3268_04970, partial [Acidiferrobacterales bacterium]|nr:hypothetical protein [Acidiferrobacterales bacterium]
MPATDVLEDELLDLLFLNAAFDNIGDATGIGGSSTAGNFEVSLHTGTLTDTSTQTTSEAAYTSYARVDDANTARAGSAWTVTSGTVTNDNAITFPQATGGSETETDFGLGSDVAASELWIYGA